MSTQLLFYGNAVPLSRQKHASLCVKTGNNFSFAGSVNSVPLTTVEFSNATPEYAVVFAGDGDAIMPVAILGAEAEQNLFVKDDGSWEGKYIPAYVRRYPFVFASNDQGETFTLCIDDSFSGCNEDGRGEHLFDADGEKTQYLDTVLNFVKEYQAQFQRTRAFCARLQELDILEPMQAQFTLPDGTPRNVTGFMAVNREKLRGLEDSVLAEMVRNGELDVIYMHLLSLQNFSKMVQRIGTKPDAEAVAESDASGKENDSDAAPLQ